MRRLQKLHKSGIASFNGKKKTGLFASNSTKVIQAKLRHFGDPHRGYSDADLKTLIEQCKNYNYAMGISIMRLLLSIEKMERKTIQDVVIQRKMSTRDVQNYLISMNHGPRRKAVGRKPIDTKSLDSTLQGIRAICAKWIQTNKCLVERLKERPFKLPKKISVEFGCLTHSIEKLAEVIELEMRKASSQWPENRLP